MDAWIDTYHAVRGLTRNGTFVFLTDSAVGSKEEDNLRHLVINLGSDVPRSKVVPFLTCKHDDGVLRRLRRSRAAGRLPVAGGARWRQARRPSTLCRACVAAARSDSRPPALAQPWRLGQSACGSGAQVAHLQDAHITAEYYLTQIVSHHSRDHVERFLAEADARGLTLPGMFGVFYYRSANPKTLRALSGFLPVPVEALTREFDAGATPEEICARSIHALTKAGVRHFYVSNLPLGRAATVLERILDAAARM